MAKKIILTETIGENKIQHLLEFNPHGVDSGWCTWPLNFDPIWVNKCTFMEEK